MSLHRHFTEHPESVGETYGEHFRVASRFAGSLAIASIAAAIHAVIPSRCETTASKRIRAMHHEMTSGARGHAAADRPAAEPVRAA